MANRIEGDTFITGNLSAKTFTAPTGSITDDGIAGAAAIAASKLQHQHTLDYSQADASDVVSEVKQIYIVRGVDATALDIQVVVKTPPTGGDKKFTVDVKRSNQAAPSLVSILSAPIVIDTSVSAFEIKAGTFSPASLIAGDVLTIEVVASGSTGSQGQGVTVTTNIREDAE